MRTLALLTIALAFGALPLTAHASWNIDFQGVNSDYNGQNGPIDYVFPNGEVGNYCSVQALVDPSLSIMFDQTPKTWSSLVDHTGATTDVAISFLASGDTEHLVGWAGTIAPPGNGQTGFNNDYLLIPSADNTLGIVTDGSYDFEITGLSGSTNYRLGLVSSSDYHNTKGLDFSFDGGAVARELRNAYLTNTIVTVQSDATGKITGTVSCPAGLTGEWGGMTIDLFPSGVIRQWNLDIGGDGISASSPQDTLPHPYGPDEFGYWNAMDVQALTGSNPEPYTVDPSVQMKDSDGTLTNVTFTLLGNCGGWTGQPVEATGDAALYKDQLILPKAGAASGWPNQHDFELTGLEIGQEYCLTFIHGAAFDTRRYLEITVDTDGDYDLGDETVTTINSMLMEKTVCFTANADGKLTGSIVFPGTSGEGDLAGIRLALLTGTPIPGDTNNDHKVDKTDARTLATYWLMDVPNGDITKGDFNGDGKVDDLDASILAANWSETSEGSQVPEPSCFVLALGMVLGLSALRKRRRRC